MICPDEEFADLLPTRLPHNNIFMQVCGCVCCLIPRLEQTPPPNIPKITLLHVVEHVCPSLVFSILACAVCSSRLLSRFSFSDGPFYTKDLAELYKTRLMLVLQLFHEASFPCDLL